MSGEGFEQSIANLILALEGQAPKIVEKMALTGKSLVQDRIQEGEGVKGAKYSQMYASMKQKKYGFTNNVVNLTATGRMWQGIQVVSSVKQGNVYIAELGGSDSEVQRKMEANEKRYGDFLKPTASEQSEIDEIVEIDIENLVRRYL